MRANIRPVNREQMMLLPPSLMEWLAEDDPVHFFIEAINGLNLSWEDFNVSDHSGGEKQYDPRMMLTLLVYCYANGIFSSRKIERATWRDIGVRVITGNTHPDHDTICTFRRKNKKLFERVFVQLALVAKEAGMVKLGTVSVDGTQIKANASKGKNIKYKRAKELEEKLKADIADLMEKAEAADHESVDDSEHLPKSLARRQKLLAKVSQAIETIEHQSADRAAKEEAKNRKNKEHNQSRKDRGNPPEGRSSIDRCHKPEAKPTDRCNTTDEDSRLMRKSCSAGFTQSYNAQAAVDADGSMLILSGYVTNNGNDTNELEPLITGIDPRLGKVDTALGDNGYVNVYAIERLEDDGIESLIPVTSEDGNCKRNYDFTESKEPKPKRIRDKRLKQMHAKMQTKEAKQKYRKRKETVEPVFGIIKSVLGFREFLLRGLEGVNIEWDLIKIAYNLKRMYAISKAAPC